MAVISRAIPTLLRGVSQSSDATKQSDHADIQDNADSNPVIGLTKRSGFNFIKTINSSAMGDVHIQTINRDLSEQYVAIFSNGNVRVFDLDGTEYTVHQTPSTSKTYLNVASPLTVRSSIKTISVADFTFVVNTSVKAKMNDTALTTGPLYYDGSSFVNITNQAIVFVNQVSANTEYTLEVDGRKCVFDSGTSNLKTSRVAEKLSAGLTSDESDVTETGTVLTAGTAGNTFNVSRNGSVVKIFKNDNSNFNIQVSDSQGNSQITLVKDSIQRFTDLPTVAPNGYVVEVKGDDQTNFDNYYVKFVTNNTTADGTLEEGKWEETTKLGIEKRVDYSTMPHVLIRQADGNFRFAEANGSTYSAATNTGIYSQSGSTAVTVTSANHGFSVGNAITVDFTSGSGSDGAFTINAVPDANTFSFTGSSSQTTSGNCRFGLTNNFTLPKYGERTVGDLDSVPDPSFIGNNINNIFFFRNRLGLLTDDNVVLSRVSEFFNFFPETVISVIDSDPIDVAASHTKVAILKHAVTMGEDLILFSEQTQFILTSSSDSLTPKTANVVVSTEFESSDDVAPVSAGNSIYFTTKRGSFAGVREYISQEDVRLRDAANITIHVPRLIPKNIFKMAVSSNEDVLVLLGTDNQNKLYVNRWLYGGDGRKVLNSWFTFTLNSGRKILNVDFVGTDLFAVIESDTTTIEKIPFETGFRESDSEFEFHLDHKVTEATTGVTVEYPHTDSNGNVVTRWTVPYKLRANMNIIGRYLAGTAATYTTTTSNNTVTITQTNHGFNTNDLVRVVKVSGSLNTGQFVITKVDNNTFTYATTTNEGSNTNENCTVGESSTYVDSNLTTRALKPGQIIQTTNTSDGSTTTITATGDYRNSKFIIGEPYEMHYRFSQQRLTETTGGTRQTEIVSGRLQLHHFYIKFEDTGFFKVEVTPENRDTSTHEFTGNLLGAASSTIGQINLETGTFRVPIMSRADRVEIDVKNSTFLPTQLSSAEYEAVFHSRSRRV